MLATITSQPTTTNCVKAYDEIFLRNQVQDYLSDKENAAKFTQFLQANKILCQAYLKIIKFKDEQFPSAEIMNSNALAIGSIFGKKSPEHLVIVIMVIVIVVIDIIR